MSVDADDIGSLDGLGATLGVNKPHQLPHAVVPLEEQLSAAHEELYRHRIAQAIAKRNPSFAGVIMRVRDGIATLNDHAGVVVDIEVPPHLTGVEPGTLVRCDDKGHIVDLLDLPLFGQTATVKRIVMAESVEVDVGGKAHTVIAPSRFNVRLQDRVLLDPLRGNVVVHNLGRVDDAFAYSDDTNVSWDDVGGQAEAKRALIEAIEEPQGYADLYKRYKKRTVKGVLCHGPAGCGKTLLGKAAATAVARLHGKKTGGFIYVKGPELLDKFVGESESNIRRIFTTARAHKEAHGVPAVVFFDEVDSLLSKRGAARSLEGMERTIVPMFLAEMDGMGESAAFVILATNRPDMLDTAVVRPGRIDRKIKIDRPSRADFEDIARNAAKDRPTQVGNLGEYIASRVFSDMPANALYMIRMTKGGEDKRFLLKELASGAMAVDVVERATQRAIRRAIAGDDTGIGHADVDASVAEVVVEEKDVDHDKVLEEFCEPFKRQEPRWEKTT